MEPVKERDAQKDPILTLTPSALAHIRRLLEREKLEGSGLRVSVVTGGCSGYSYKLDFDKEIKAGDRVLEQDGISIYVDESAQAHIDGTVIDYKTSLMASVFTFENPSATGTCGCGTSFSV